jgi:hypothetical protein
VENQPPQLGGAGALILRIVQFLISIGAALLFGIMPSSRMFGDQVTSKSRKYFTSHTSTTCYSILHFQARLGAPSYASLYLSAVLSTFNLHSYSKENYL